jgi:hypothetical protein
MPAQHMRHWRRLLIRLYASAAIVTALVSRFMWWACRRPAVWGMGHSPGK